MHVTHLGRPAGESYTMRKAVDPDAGIEYLYRTYDEDGVTTVATRVPGETWGPEVELPGVTA
jgi:hypothetical protein